MWADVAMSYSLLPQEGLVDGIKLTPEGLVPVEGALLFSVPKGVTVA